MLNGQTHKDELYGAMPLFGKNAPAASGFKKLMEEKRRKEQNSSLGLFEKNIKTSNAKNDLVFALVRLGTVLYTHGVCEAGKYTLSFFMRLRHNDLIQNAMEFIELAGENSSVLKKAGLKKTVIQDLENKLKTFRNSLENKVLSFC